MRLLRTISISEINVPYYKVRAIEINGKGKDVTSKENYFLRRKLSLCSLRSADLPKLFLLTARDLRRLFFICLEPWL